MELVVDITTFPNNSNNQRQLPVLTESQLIDPVTHRFLHRISSVPDGMYYYNSDWPYICITNERIFIKVYYAYPQDEVPLHIEVMQYHDDMIETYICSPQCNPEFKLLSVIPDTDVGYAQVYAFLDILYASGYEIVGDPYYVFDEIGGTHQDIRLTLGSIQRVSYA